MRVQLVAFLVLLVLLATCQSYASDGEEVVWPDLEAEWEEPYSDETPPIGAAYDEVIRWGMHLGPASASQSDERVTDVKERLTRASGRYALKQNLALAVVCVEGFMAPEVSAARRKSWQVYEEATDYKMSRYPDVFNDLDTCLSTLAVTLQKSKTISEALRDYWSGPDNANSDSVSQFIEYTMKIFTGLDPDHGDLSSNAILSSTSYGEPFVTKLPRPYKLEELVYFQGHEEAYARQAKKFNKHLTDSESRKIARAILNYCARTGWYVDPRLVMAVIAHESAFTTRITAGAEVGGIARLSKARAKAYSLNDTSDVLQSTYGCVRYLEREQYRWRNSTKPLETIIASYKLGWDQIEKDTSILSTKNTVNYVTAVKTHYRRFCDFNESGDIAGFDRYLLRAKIGNVNLRGWTGPKPTELGGTYLKDNVDLTIGFKTYSVNYRIAKHGDEVGTVIIDWPSMVVQTGANLDEVQTTATILRMDLLSKYGSGQVTTDTFGKKFGEGTLAFRDMDGDVLALIWDGYSLSIGYASREYLLGNRDTQVKKYEKDRAKF